MTARLGYLGPLGVASLVLVACRGIVGIEPLELVDGGRSDSESSSSSGDGAAADTGQVDAGHDARSDAHQGRDSGPDVPVTNCPTMGSMCLGCCRMTVGGSDFAALENYGRLSGCLCGSGACQSACSTSVCATPPGPMNMTCGMCTDPQLVSMTAACVSAGDMCAKDSTCAAAIDCLRSCPPPP